MKEKLLNGELSFDGISADDFKTRTRLDSITSTCFEKEDLYLNLKNIGYLFLEPWIKYLGITAILNRIKSDSKIEYDLLGLTKLLIFGRILEPKSEKDTFENKDKYLFPVTTSENLNEVYKALGVLDSKCDNIQKRINTKIKQSSVGRSASVTYYDVTNYFFETHYPDEDIYKFDDNGEAVYDDTGSPVILEKGFRKKGACKKHSGKPIVSMGLFIDGNGLPVSYSLFPGITAENIKKSLNDFQIDKSNKLYFKITKPNEHINLLSDTIGINSNLELPTPDEIKRFRNNLYTSF